MADTAPENPNPNPNPEKSTPKKPYLLLRTKTICASLLLFQVSIALTLFAFSYRKYTTWFRTSHHLSRTNDLVIHTTLFIATCAPLCSILGVAVSAAYYWRKRRKYGKYDVKMRRKGRGYWVDPSDGADKAVSDEALKINAQIRKNRERGERILADERESGNGGGGSSTQQANAGNLSFTLPVVPVDGGRQESKRASFFSNPYGWFPKEEEARDGARGLGRLDSVRTCESDETMRRGVFDIWLGRKSGDKGKENIEMVSTKT